MNEGMPNPLTFLWRAVYDTAATFTGMVGLTPEQVGLGALALLLLAVVVQVVMAATGKRTWSLD